MTKAFVLIYSAARPLLALDLERTRAHLVVSIYVTLNIGLMGDDMTDCSYLLVYIMSSFIWRLNIQKIFSKI